MIISNSGLFLTESEKELASPDDEEHWTSVESWTETWSRKKENRRAPERAEKWAKQRRNDKIRGGNRRHQVSSSTVSLWWMWKKTWVICKTYLFLCCGRKRDDRLDWMYQGPAGHVSRDEYLLGRPIDKQITDQYEEPESGPSNETGLLPGSIFNPSAQVSTLDLAAKIREDPLFAIRLVHPPYHVV